MASNSGLFKPNAGGGSLGTKRTENGQFMNPPAYPETSGFTGPSKVAEKSVGGVQKSPTAKSGRV